MTQPAHTPTPWNMSPYYSSKIEAQTPNGRSRHVASTSCSGRAIEEQEANAAYIVKCVNCHVELVAVLKEAVDYQPSFKWLDKANSILDKVGAS